MGDVDAVSACSVLLADADVLIDYLQSEFAILALVAIHVGRVVVLEQVLAEVRGLTAQQCANSGIEVITAQTERMLQAAAVESNVSFSDRLCLVTCREERWTCVTNDRALRRLCLRQGVGTRYGLSLIHGRPGRRRSSDASACRVDRSTNPVSNPFHINERVLERFTARCRAASSPSR